MTKGLGIAVLIIAIVAIFVPVVSIFVVWIALLLAAIAGFLGERIFTVAAIATSLVNVLFLSPLTLAGFGGERMAGGSFYLWSTVTLFIASIAAVIVGAYRGMNKKEAKAPQSLGS